MGQLQQGSVHRCYQTLGRHSLVPPGHLGQFHLCHQTLGRHSLVPPGHLGQFHHHLHNHHHSPGPPSALSRLLLCHVPAATVLSSGNKHLPSTTMSGDVHWR